MKDFVTPESNNAFPVFPLTEIPRIGHSAGSVGSLIARIPCEFPTSAI